MISSSLTFLQLIEDAVREKTTQLTTNNNVGDNQSVTSGSGRTTPASQKGKSDRRDSKKKTPVKLDKAVIEGMTFLQEHEGLKSTTNTEKQKLAKALKENDRDHLTSDMILNNLKTGTRGRKVDYTPFSSSKRSAKKSVVSEQDDASQGGNAQAIADIDLLIHREILSTPVQSGTKKARKTASKVSNKMDDNISIQLEDFEE